jgi:hypothetical protein
MKAAGELRLIKVTCRISPKRILNRFLMKSRKQKYGKQNWGSGFPAYFCFLLFQFLLLPSFAQPKVTPAQYLASQPKPNFAAGTRLPCLTRWGWCLSSNATVELANNWGYALTLSGYATPTIASNTTIPGTFDYGMVQLAKNNPTKYKLSVMLDRTYPSFISAGFWCTNSSGLFMDIYSNTWRKNVYITTGSGGGHGAWLCSTNTTASGRYFNPVPSPEVPAIDLSNAAEYSMNSLRVIQSNAPIAIVLNGGEYGLDVAGFGEVAWSQDPRVQVQAVMTNPWTASNTSGMSWPRYSSNRKAHQLGFLTTAIQQLLPNRELYIFYNTGNEQNRYTAEASWFNADSYWGWNSDVMVTNTDLPSFEDYYSWKGWVSVTNPFPNDILTRHLDAVGYNKELGHPLNYSWVNGGSGTNMASFSDIPHYMGFLKCLYTSGMVGGIAAYFDYPAGGFDVAFPTNNPPQWLLQIIALSHVHALFSHLDNFTYNGDLLTGPQAHEMSKDQPAYEFTNTAGYANDRVLARNMRVTNLWLVTAWAVDGITNNVTVTIPTVGNLTVTAIPSASVYLVTMIGTNVQQMLLDEYASFPTPTNLHIIPQ